MCHSRPLFLYFRLFNTQLTVNKCSIYLVSEATAIPTEPQPLPQCFIYFKAEKWLNLFPLLSVLCLIPVDRMQVSIHVIRWLDYFFQCSRFLAGYSHLNTCSIRRYLHLTPCSIRRYLYLNTCNICRYQH